MHVSTGTLVTRPKLVDEIIAERVERMRARYERGEPLWDNEREYWVEPDIEVRPLLDGESDPKNAAEFGHDKKRKNRSA